MDSKINENKILNAILNFEIKEIVQKLDSG